MPPHLNGSAAPSSRQFRYTLSAGRTSKREAIDRWRKCHQLATSAVTPDPSDVRELKSCFAEHRGKIYTRMRAKERNALQAFITHLHERSFDKPTDCSEQRYDLSTERHQTDAEVQALFISKLTAARPPTNSEMSKLAPSSSRFKDIQLAFAQQQQGEEWEKQFTAADEYLMAREAVRSASTLAKRSWLSNGNLSALHDRQGQAYRTFVTHVYRLPERVNTMEPTEQELSIADECASFIVHNSIYGQPNSIANMVHRITIGNEDGLQSCDPPLSYAAREKLRDIGQTYQPNDQVRAWKQYQEESLQEAAQYEAVRSNSNNADSDRWNSSVSLLRSAYTQPVTFSLSMSPSLPPVVKLSKHLPVLQPLFEDHYAPALSSDPQLEAASEGLRFLSLRLPESLGESSAILLEACDRFITLNPRNQAEAIDRHWLDTGLSDPLVDDASASERHVRRSIAALRDLLNAVEDDQTASRRRTRSASEDYVKKFPKWDERTEECRRALHKVRLAADKMTGRYKTSLPSDLDDTYKSLVVDEYARYAAKNTLETTGKTYSFMKKRYGCHNIASHLLKTEKERRANSPWM